MGNMEHPTLTRGTPNSSYTVRKISIGSCNNVALVDVVVEDPWPSIADIAEKSSRHTRPIVAISTPSPFHVESR